MALLLNMLLKRFKQKKPSPEANIYTVLEKFSQRYHCIAQVIQKNLVGENFLETIFFLVKIYFCGN